MHIAIEWHDKQFNVNLSSKEGAEAFLSIKGCRVVSGSDGDFVGWPATKNENTGKWWRHVWGSDKFAAAVLKAAEESRPSSKAKARDGDAEDDIPF